MGSNPQIDVEHLNIVLENNQLKIYTAIIPLLLEILMKLPAVKEKGQILQLYSSNKDEGTTRLLDLIQQGNEQLWFEFLSALDASLKDIRRLFCSDEEWKGE